MEYKVDVKERDHAVDALRYALKLQVAAPLRAFKFGGLTEIFKLTIGQKVEGQNLTGKSFAPQIQAKPAMPIFSSIPSDDTSIPFVRKDVFVEYAKRMDERCCKHEEFIKEFREEQIRERERTDRLVKSTLVFVVITLVTILGAIGWGVFR